MIHISRVNYIYFSKLPWGTSLGSGLASTVLSDYYNVYKNVGLNNKK